MRPFLIVLLLSPSLATAAVVASETAIFTPLGDLPGDAFGFGFYSEAEAISPGGGFIVGRSASARGMEPMRWSNSVGIQGLDQLPGAYHTFAKAVNDGGVVVGGASTGCVYSSCTSAAWRFDPLSGFEGLGWLPQSSQAIAYDISNNGTIVGWSGDSEEAAYGVAHAFVWESATGMRSLGDLAGGEVHSVARAVNRDGSVVAGWSVSGNGREAFRWSSADSKMVGLGDFDGGGFRSEAYAMDSTGSLIVGVARGVGDYDNAFLWRDGIDGLLALNPGSLFWQSWATAVSGDVDGAAVVVGGGFVGEDRRAFYWTESRGMLDLQSLLHDGFGLSEELAGWTLTEATGVDASGRIIVGFGVSPRGIEGFRIEFIPEPSALVLFLVPGWLLGRRGRSSGVPLLQRP